MLLSGVISNRVDNKILSVLVFAVASAYLTSQIKSERSARASELECADVGLRKAVENIAEGAIAHSRNVVLYRGMVKPFKDCMEAEGFTVEAVYLEHHWRSPLDVLRVIAWAKRALWHSCRIWL
jgi:hypothetical protein